MPRKILVVDDDREVSRFLHSTLEVLDSTAQFIEIRSAEEALLETRRTAFDLYVLDVLLPGMDGIELSRRILKQQPSAKIILLTGKPTPQIESEIRSLNVAFFPKPIKPEDLMNAASKALGIKPTSPSSSPSIPQAERPPMNESRSVSERLTGLRRDVGCLAVYLGDLDGQIVARAGDVSGFAVEDLLSHVMVAFTASLKVCGFLGGFVPLNMHFFDGDDFDVYMLNVGQSYSIIVLFSGESGARAMGNVLRYGRQCADDLLNVLAESAPIAMSEPTPKRATAPLMEKVQMVAAGGETIEVEMPVAAPAGSVPPQMFEPEPAEVLDIKFDQLDAAAKSVSANDLDSFWDDATTENESSSSRANALSFEQAMKLGLVPKEK